MKPKIALIIDKSDSYISFKRDVQLRDWDIDKSQTQVIQNISEALGGDLFGDSYCSLLSIKSTDAVKKITEAFTKGGEELINDVSENGLIIMLHNVNRNSSKKLEKIAIDNDFYLVIPPAKGEEDLSKRMVNEFGFKREVKDFLLDYIGQDYEKAIPLLVTLSEVPKKMHSRITIEDLKIRLPQPPGSIPPWDIEPAILSGDVNKSIELARRINKNSNHLVWMSMFKNKLANYQRISNILELNPKMSDGELTKVLGLNPRGFYYTKKTVVEYKPEVWTKALGIFIKTEGNVKGDSAAPSGAEVEVMLAILCEIFKKERGR